MSLTDERLGEINERAMTVRSRHCTEGGDTAAYHLARDDVPELMKEIDRLQDEADGSANDAIELRVRHLEPARKEIARLKGELAEAKRDAESLRLVLAMHGGGTDPQGVYVGTPGFQLRLMNGVVNAARDWKARIKDPEELWADQEDRNLIAAVFALEQFAKPAEPSQAVVAEAVAHAATAKPRPVKESLEWLARMNTIANARITVIGAATACVGDLRNAGYRLSENARALIAAVDALIAAESTADGHPEDHCHRCGGPNITWAAPSPLWNEVMRGGDIEGRDLHDGIVCPTCFAVLAEKMGLANYWQFNAPCTTRELTMVTPSGRVWDAERWLWVEPSTADGPEQTDGPESLWGKGCPRKVWDGPYSYRCGLGGDGGECAYHGKFAEPPAASEHKHEAIPCPRWLYRGGYGDKQCPEVLKDFKCPTHGFIREASSVSEQAEAGGNG